MADVCRALRKSQTAAEEVMWRKLRNRQLANCKFRRQHPFTPFIVDFVCLEKRLIVEVDGGQHFENRANDEKRTRFLETRGFRVLRFWNNEVLTDIDAVLERISQTLDSID